MKRKIGVILTAIFLLSGISVSANAAVIDFTGGTVYDFSGTAIGTTSAAYDYYDSNADYYTENGFKLDFIAPQGDWNVIGDYYGVDKTGNNNDVIHGHWASGDFGGMTAIEITEVGAASGSTFDLNYFILTSNTDTGGSTASGLEETYIQAWTGGTMTYEQLLPSEDWGWFGAGLGYTQIYLGSEFDAVDMVRFVVKNEVDCFGMDEFYINEEAPPVVPEPTTFLLFGIGILGLAGVSRKKTA